MSEAVRRTIRTVLQLVASGALTALVNDWANGLEPALLGLVLGLWQVIVTYAQNKLEEEEVIPTVLK